MKIPLTNGEKAKLRKRKMRIAHIPELSIADLAEILEVPEKRAQELKGIAIFQQIPSIGHHLAAKMVHNLGICSLEELKGADGAVLCDRLELEMGVWTDPCVEDQIRCLVHHSEHQDSKMQWHHFTSERKKYRSHYGYPETRPKLAWYELREEHAHVPDD
ncbi:helix-hairpin-helix domain-containing protein [Halobacillus litoralis]|uniref:Pathogenicity locus n=1 Tax=Halobacillus litoralis TaxID=45668 RepID=A0A410MHV5_9BACI|nr:helix-hairpin-helix domain-containing protein [Halobacillus litoralis]QAS54309.1 Pathogenicity locus [Halobacillus litoralis]